MTVMNSVQEKNLKIARHQPMVAKERLFNSILFESLALGLTIPLSKFITDKEINDVAIVSVFMSLYCVFWNYVYNLIFEKLYLRAREQWSTVIRIMHSVGFETTLIVGTVPFIALMLDISFVAALELEAGLLVFFFIYTFVFNWGYDKFIHVIVNKWFTISV